MIHSFKGFKDRVFFPTPAATLSKNGLAVIAFNLSMNGIGEDPHQFTELDKFAHLTHSREQEDIQFLTEHTKTKNLPLSTHLDITKIGFRDIAEVEEITCSLQ